MELLQKILEFVRVLPAWSKVLSVIVVTLVSIILFFSSCVVSQSLVTGDGNTSSNGGNVEVVFDSTYMNATFPIPVK